MTYLEYIAELARLKLLNENTIISIIPDVEQFAYDALLQWMDESLELRNGSLIASEETIAILNEFDAGYLQVINEIKEYRGAVTSFVKRLPEIGNVIKLFQENTNLVDWGKMDIEPTQKLVINEILQSYTDNGLNTEFVQPLRDLLYQNIVAGTSVKEARKTLEDFIKGGGDSSGKLKRYLTQTSQQAVDAYTGAVNKKLMETFDFPYVIMSGSLISTSLPQCVYGIKVLKGIISKEDFEKKLKPIAEKHAWITGTTFQNLDFNKLHYGCRHEFTPSMLRPGDRIGENEQMGEDGPTRNRISIDEYNSLPKSKYPIKKLYTSGGFYAVHKRADRRDPLEYHANVETAKAIAKEKGLRVYIREHSHKPGVKNPEYMINGLLADRKRPAFEPTPDKEAYKSIVNPISQNTLYAERQGSEAVVIDVFKRYNIKELEEGIKYGFRDAPKIQQIIINFRDEKFAVIEREMFIKGKILENLKNDYLGPL
ncbi:MAG: hypothetical protein WKF88_09345 [Ferruginibacter sp.]